MRKETKKNSKTPVPKFKANWIYIGLISLLLVMMFLPKGNSVKKVDMRRLETMLKAGDVKKIVLINSADAEVYLKPESLANKK